MIIDELNKSVAYNMFGSRAKNQRRLDKERLNCIRRLIKKMLAEKGVNPFFEDNSGQAVADMMPELRQYI